MTKLSERTQISDANLTDDCFVHIVKPGTPDTSWYGTLEQLRNTIGGSWTRATFDLTQAQIRVLQSANGGFGFELFDAQGANKIVQISNAILRFNKTAGTFPQSFFEIYSANNENYAAIMNFDNSSESAPTNNSVYIFNSRNNGLVLGYFETSQLINDKIYLYANADFADYEGTAKLILDYRVIDFT